jgi:hypothetical protein
MRADRLLASASVAAPGVVLLVPTLGAVVDGAGLATLAIAAIGALVGLSLVVAGGLLYRSGFSDRATLRVAGWNLFGLAVLGTVFTLPFLLGLFRAPSVFIATAVGVSTLAHVLIGVTDVRRIRAERAAARRSTMATLSRRFLPTVRADAASLRTATDLLVDLGDDRVAELAGEARVDAAALGSTAVLADGVRTVTDRGPADRPARDLAGLVEDATADARELHPDADVAVSVPQGVPVPAGEELTAAVAVVLADALEKHDRVGASASAGQEVVELRLGPEAAFDGGAGAVAPKGDGRSGREGSSAGFGRWAIERVAAAAGGSASFDGPGLAPATIRLERAAGPAE